MLHGGTIAVYPLQIYSSALIFSPENSLVRRELLLDTSDWLTRYHPARGEWDLSLFESDGLFPTAFSSDRRLLADRDLQVWIVDHGPLVYSIPLSAELGSVAFNPTGPQKFAPHANTMASGSTWCGPITSWDLSQTASPADASVTEHAHQIVASTDKTSIIFTSSTSGSRKSTLNSINFGQDHAPPSIKCVEYEHSIEKVQLLPGSQLAFVSAHVEDGYTTGYLLDSGAWARTPIPPCETLSVSPSGSYLALAGLDHRIHIRHTSMQDFTVCPPGHRTAVQMIQFSPSDKQLVSVSTDGQVLLWDTQGQSGPVVLEYGLGNRVGKIREAVFSADENMLACAYWDQTSIQSWVQLWNLGTGEPSRGLGSAHLFFRMRTLSFSPDGRYLRTVDKTFDLSESPTASLDLGTPIVIDPYRVWITWHGKRVLKLPPGYRFERYHSQDNILVIGCKEGGVAFLEFDPQKLREALGI